jgi:aspartate/methionine/tyrosine aminotransferase
VLHLEVGQPATPAPAGARQVAAQAIATETLGYTGAAGLPALREAISGWYRDRYRLSIPAERIVVTTGASGGCLLAFLALFEAGQRVGVLEPGYPCYRNDLQALGVEPVPIPVGHDTGFRPTVEQLEAVGHLDGLVLASPSNPTGTVLPSQELAALVAWAERSGVRLVVDEIYHGITYDGPAPSALAHSDQLVVINSFSKYFSMTGWRVGWLVAPNPIAEAAERLGQSLAIAAPTPGQVAALAAFDCIDELEANVERYRRHRRLLLDGLATLGLDRSAPADGAFYVYTDVSELGLDSPELCRRWLDELGVAATPGIDFDPVRGHQFVRFSYAGSEQEITEAVRRLGTWLGNTQPDRPATPNR